MFGGLLLFSIIPFIQNILYSFRKMGTFGDGTFVGLANYRKLLTDDTFWLALKNTVFYAVVGVPLVIVFSIYLAHLLNKKLRGRTLYRTLLFIPAVTIPAAIGILWRWILNYQYGIFNWLLEKLGLPRVSWLGDVKYVRWAIILVVVWSMVSTYVIIMLAAMQGIDSSYYEAARLDGASSRQVFFKNYSAHVDPHDFLLCNHGDYWHLADIRFYLSDGGSADPVVYLQHEPCDLLL